MNRKVNDIIDSHAVSERLLKFHYIKKEYEIIQQLIKINNYSSLSDKELFFVADSQFSVYHRNNLII